MRGRFTTSMLLVALLGASSARAQDGQELQDEQEQEPQDEHELQDEQELQGEQEQEQAEPQPVEPIAVHVPVHSAASGDEVHLRFETVHAQRLGEIVVRHRPIGGEDVSEVSAEVYGEGLVARIPASSVVRPGVEYWIVERRDDGDRAVFASEDEPHRFAVHESTSRARERESLESRDGRRSRARLQGEYVSLGRRIVPDASGMLQARAEHYYLIEASYSYSFFTAVEHIQLSLGRMRGNVVGSVAGDEDDRGIDYGRADILWRLHDIVWLGTGVTFGFSQTGFELGGRGELIVGERERTSLTLGVDGVSTLGATGYVRLGWATLPRLPMGATVEITTWPAGDNAGVRLLYDIAYELYPGAFVRVEAGYRGWSSVSGGVSAGGELALAF